MRTVFFAAVTALLIASCKSKDKQQDTAKTTPPPAPAKAETKADTKAAAKEKKAVPSPAATSATKVECKNGGDARVLEVRGKDSGCEVGYTKAGQENVVGSSQNGTTHCEGIMNRIKDKLVAAGFTCN